MSGLKSVEVGIFSNFQNKWLNFSANRISKARESRIETIEEDMAPHYRNNIGGRFWDFPFPIPQF